MGRRKEKKDKKDRGYATLDGESSEEDFETKYVCITIGAQRSTTFTKKNYIYQMALYNDNIC